MRSSPRSLAWAFALAACGEPATVVPADGGTHPDASASTDLPAPMDAPAQFDARPPVDTPAADTPPVDTPAPMDAGLPEVKIGRAHV